MSPKIIKGSRTPLILSIERIWDEIHIRKLTTTPETTRIHQTAVSQAFGLMWCIAEASHIDRMKIFCATQAHSEVIHPDNTTIVT
jgi:hypothetical protein